MNVMSYDDVQKLLSDSFNETKDDTDDFDEMSELSGDDVDIDVDDESDSISLDKEDQELNTTDSCGEDCDCVECHITDYLTQSTGDY